MAFVAIAIRQAKVLIRFTWIDSNRLLLVPVKQKDKKSSEFSRNIVLRCIIKKNALSVKYHCLITLSETMTAAFHSWMVWSCHNYENLLGLDALIFPDKMIDWALSNDWFYSNKEWEWIWGKISDHLFWLLGKKRLERCTVLRDRVLQEYKNELKCFHTSKSTKLPSFIMNLERCAAETCKSSQVISCTTYQHNFRELLLVDRSVWEHASIASTITSI